MSQVGQGTRRPHAEATTLLSSGAMVLALGLTACAAPALEPPSGKDRQPPAATEESPVPAAASSSPVAPAPIPAPASEGYLGVVVAREEVDVASDVAGRLERVVVRGGDPVRRGDLLAVLDTSPLRQDLAMAKASLRASRAEVSRSRSQFQEAETRYQRRAAVPDTFSREEVAAAALERDTAQAALEAAEAGVAEQELRVEQLQDSIGRAEIRAPFDGTVSLRYLDPGSTVLSGAPVLRLLNTEELLVRFAVPPEEVGRLRLDLSVTVDIAEATLETRGSIQRIAPEIDGPSRMIFVEARLAAGEIERLRLRAGQVAKVVVTAG